jgi:hypothetical protein
MFPLVFVLVSLVLVAFALWWGQRGEGSTVLGQGNNFESYYGKDRWQPGVSPPCSECVNLGCIGAGECRCACHKPFKAKK